MKQKKSDEKISGFEAGDGILRLEQRAYPAFSTTARSVLDVQPPMASEFRALNSREQSFAEVAEVAELES